MALGALVMMLLVLVCFIFVPKLSDKLVANSCTDGNCDNDSAIAIASQMGRLDVVSLVLGVTGIGIGGFAIFSFFAIKENAELIARAEARRIASEEATNIAEQRIDWFLSTIKLRLPEEPDSSDFDHLTKGSEELTSNGK